MAPAGAGPERAPATRSFGAGCPYRASKAKPLARRGVHLPPGDPFAPGPTRRNRTNRRPAIVNLCMTNVVKDEPSRSRTAEIKRLLASGQYRIDPAAVAEAMIRRGEFGLYGRTTWRPRPAPRPKRS
jgi:hypothetical protein